MIRLESRKKGSDIKASGSWRERKRVKKISQGGEVRALKEGVLPGQRFHLRIG